MCKLLNKFGETNENILDLKRESRHPRRDRVHDQYLGTKQKSAHIEIHRGEKSYRCDWPQCHSKSVKKTNLDIYKTIHT
jgi:hypothetical protein